MSDLREMPSSLNDACRKLELAYAEIAALKENVVALCGTADRYLKEAERLSVVVEQTLWWPIETAPKDGTNILARAWREGQPVVRVTWWRQPKDAKGYIGWGEFNEHFWPPTHWMPIPAFPSDERA